MVIERTPSERAEIIAIAAIKAIVETAKTTVDAIQIAVDSIHSDVTAEQQREIFIFPEDTSRVCTITAGNPANTWSAWAEITDSLATTFSSKITAPVHVTMVLPEDVTDRNQVYYFELSYGAARICIARRRFSPDKELGVIGVDMYGKLIPAGEIVYGRMMCTSAGEGANIVVRYHYHV